MFTIKRKMPTKIQEEIDRNLSLMGVSRPISEEYGDYLKNVERLHKLEGDEKSSKKCVSPDTILVVAANLVGIGMVLHYEKLGVITSKAFGWILKGRV